MTLTRSVTVYHGKSPLVGDAQLQWVIDRERQFCAVFDLADDRFNSDHKAATDALFDYCGRSPMPVVSYLRPFLVNPDGIVVFPESLSRDITSATLERENCRIGGFFFDEAIAGFVIPGLRDLGYQVDKKYKELQRA